MGVVKILAVVLIGTLTCELTTVQENVILHALGTENYSKYLTEVNNISGRQHRTQPVLANDL